MGGRWRMPNAGAGPANARRAHGGRIAHLIATQEHHASSSASSDAGSIPSRSPRPPRPPPCDRIVPSRHAGRTADAEENHDTGAPRADTPWAGRDPRGDALGSETSAHARP